MAKTEPVILTTMVMVYDGDRILVQDRLDPAWPGVTFPGGHVEPCESFVRCAEREVFEETGLSVSDLRLVGLKQFTHRNGDFRYIVFFYRTAHFTGELSASDEGCVFWISRSDLHKYTLADGFAEMLEIFENDSLSENYHWFDGQWHQKNL